jgi:hypothetical protein
MPSRIVSGTLDFKWPRHKTIVVAFQALPEKDAKQGPDLKAWIKEFKARAAAWLTHGVGLKFEYLGQPLPAPSQVTVNGETLYGARSAIDQKTVFIDYDLLISFASMPMWFEPPGAAPVKLTGQASVLGAYAQRANWGNPTMLLGPNVNQLANKTRHDHLKSAAFKHIVAHEIGHALGLAHEHQNPKYHRAKLVAIVDDTSLKGKLDALGSEFNTVFDAAELNREVRDPWPMPDPAWSEWREWVGQSDTTRPEDLSVMVYPEWSTFLKNSAAFVGPVGTRHSGPTDSDLRQLKAMYPA